MRGKGRFEVLKLYTLHAALYTRIASAPSTSVSFSGFGVYLTLIAFSDGDHEYPDLAFLNLIDKPVTGSLQFDLIVILEAAEAVRRDIRVLKKFRQLFLELLTDAVIELLEFLQSAGKESKFIAHPVRFLWHRVFLWPAAGQWLPVQDPQDDPSGLHRLQQG